MSVLDATRDELTKGGRLDSALGQQALVLADQVDAGAEMTGSALAAVAKELRTTLAEAMRSATMVKDPIDELRERRERRRRGA